MAIIQIDKNKTNAQAQALMDTANPGDTVSFEKGGTWSGGLQIRKSGTSGSPITYNSYGTGNAPIITNKEAVPGWTTSSNWYQTDLTNYPNVWQIDTIPATSSTYRLWLNGTEARRASNWNTINATDNYYNDTRYSGSFYVYATSNPSSYYSKVEWTGNNNVPFDSNDQDYWIMDGLDIRGGYNVCFQIYKSSFFTIQNCFIGYECNRNGLGTWHKCTDGLITNNIIDTGLTHYWDYYIDMYATNDGFYMINGAHRLTFTKNIIRNFMHSGIGVEGAWFTGTDFDATLENGYILSDVLIADNLIECTTVSYMRGIGASATNDRYSNNFVFTRNMIKGCPINSQIGLNYMEFSYNLICDNQRDPDIQPQSLGSHGGLTLAGGNSSMGRYMKIHNNTFANLADNGIRVSFGMETFPQNGTISFSSSSNIVTGVGTAFTQTFPNLKKWEVGDFVWVYNINISPNVQHDIIGRVASIDSDTQLTLTTNALTTKSGASFIWARTPGELAHNVIENNLLYNCAYNSSRDWSAFCAISIENTMNPYPKGGPVDGYVHSNTFRNNMVYTPGRTYTQPIVYDNRRTDTGVTTNQTLEEFNTLGNGFRNDVISNNVFVNPVLNDPATKKYYLTSSSPANSGGLTQSNTTALNSSSNWPYGVVTETVSAGSWPIGAYAPYAVSVPTGIKAFLIGGKIIIKNGKIVIKGSNLAP